MTPLTHEPYVQGTDRMGYTGSERYTRCMTRLTRITHLYPRAFRTHVLSLDHHGSDRCYHGGSRRGIRETDGKDTITTHYDILLPHLDNRPHNGYIPLDSRWYHAPGLYHIRYSGHCLVSTARQYVHSYSRVSIGV